MNTNAEYKSKAMEHVYIVIESINMFMSVINIDNTHSTFCLSLNFCNCTLVQRSTTLVVEYNFYMRF